MLDRSTVAAPIAPCTELPTFLASPGTRSGKHVRRAVREPEPQLRQGLCHLRDRSGMLMLAMRPLSKRRRPPSRSSVSNSFSLTPLRRLSRARRVRIEPYRSC